MSDYKTRPPMLNAEFCEYPHYILWGKIHPFKIKNPYDREKHEIGRYVKKHNALLYARRISDMTNITITIGLVEKEGGIITITNTIHPKEK